MKRYVKTLGQISETHKMEAMSCKKREESITFSQRDGRLFGIDGVQDALVADLGFGYEGDLRAKVGDPSGRHLR